LVILIRVGPRLSAANHPAFARWATIASTVNVVVTSAESRQNWQKWPMTNACR